MNDAGKMLWGSFSAQDIEAHSLDRRPDVVAMSRGEMYLASCCNILRYGHGFVASTNVFEPRDASGNWVPLFTYPCIEYLRQFDLRGKRVFEWGSGASTLYWMQRAEAVTSIENNRQWFDAMLQMKNEKVKLVLEETERFPFRIRDETEKFDVIVIDSYGYRYDCAVEALAKLAPGGMVILDNSDWHPMSSGVLKKSGLIQVDFSGFKVTECHTSTTSVFLHRDFDLPTLEARQPTYCIGAKQIVSGWDKPYAKQPSDRES
ncbi:MAG: hypothetical protein ACREPY_04375 [Rhodanobacteraceae bacterium]